MAENETKDDALLAILKPRNKHEDLLRLANASRFAGISTGVGVLVVVGTIVYSMWQLNSLEASVLQKKNDLADAEHKRSEAESRRDQAERTASTADARVQAKQAELKKAEGELAAKQAQLTALNETLKKANQELAKTQEVLEAGKVQLKRARDDKADFQQILNTAKPSEAWLDERKNLPALVKLAVQPTARAEIVSTGGPRPIYNFILSLKFSPEYDVRVRSKIKQVVYEFNYPGFREPEVGKDAAKGFPVSYQGWGAVRNVILIIHLENGDKVPMDMDMTKHLPGIAEKAPPPPTIDY